jgi:hypothetical protein
MLGLNMAAGSLARMIGPLLAGPLFGLAIGGPYWLGAVLMLPAIWLRDDHRRTRQAGRLIDSLAFRVFPVLTPPFRNRLAIGMPWRFVMLS